MDEETIKEYLAGLRKRARECQEIADSYAKRGCTEDATRCAAKAFAYDHAADLLERLT